MKQTPSLVSPYPGRAYGGKDTTRLSLDIPNEDYHTIRLCSLENSYVHNAVKLFINPLAQTCRANNWTLQNKHELTEHILSRTTSERPPTGQPDQGPHNHDRRGTGSVGRGTKKHTNKHAAIGGDETEATDVPDAA